MHFLLLRIVNCIAQIHLKDLYSLELQTDWMRIGAFLFDSHDALLTENLIESIKVPKEDTPEKLLPKEGYCLLNNIKSGIWIAGSFFTVHLSFFKYIDLSCM